LTPAIGTTAPPTNEADTSRRSLVVVTRICPGCLTTAERRAFYEAAILILA
jgi:hypothetical protein